MSDQQERKDNLKQTIKALDQQEKISRLARRKRLLAIPDDEWNEAEREDVANEKSD